MKDVRTFSLRRQLAPDHCCIIKPLAKEAWGGTRTHNPEVKSHTLYPVELPRLVCQLCKKTVKVDSLVDADEEISWKLPRIFHQTP